VPSGRSKLTSNRDRLGLHRDERGPEAVDVRAQQPEQGGEQGDGDEHGDRDGDRDGDAEAGDEGEDLIRTAPVVGKRLAGERGDVGERWAMTRQDTDRVLRQKRSSEWMYSTRLWRRPPGLSRPGSRTGLGVMQARRWSPESRCRLVLGRRPQDLCRWRC
jgi:hypothetical protein